MVHLTLHFLCCCRDIIFRINVEIDTALTWSVLLVIHKSKQFIMIGTRKIKMDSFGVVSLSYKHHSKAISLERQKILLENEIMVQYLFLSRRLEYCISFSKIFDPGFYFFWSIVDLF